MRKILLTLMLLLTVAFLSFGQDIRPIGTTNLQSPSFSVNLADGSLYIYKNSTIGYTKILSADLVQAKTDSLGYAFKAYADGKVSDATYDSVTWNGVDSIAPSKNAIRDKIITMEAATYTATTITVNTGTLTQGPVSNTWSLGGTDVIVTEASGTNPLTVTFAFSGVERVNNFTFYGRYAGGASHVINMEIYNYSTTVWDLLGELGYSSNKQWYSWGVFLPTSYISSGNMQVRFNHQDNGIPSHTLILDYVNVNFGGSSGGTFETASEIAFVPTGNIAGTNVQSAIHELDLEKQNNITVTTLGTTGPATLSGDILNIPQYTGGSSGAVNGGSGVDYFYVNSASDIFTYEILSRSPDSGAEVDDTTVSSSSSKVLIGVYASDAAGIGGTSIDAGVWTFDTWAYVSILNLASKVVIDVYKRTSGGTETLLFSTETPAIMTTSLLTIQGYEVTTVQQAFSINATDRLITKIYGQSANLTPTTIHFVHGGTEHYSHINTPLVVRHNDLVGRDVSDAHPASAITNTPYSTIAAITGQAAIDELTDEKVQVSPASAQTGDIWMGGKIGIANQPFPLTEDVALWVNKTSSNSVARGIQSYVNFNGDYGATAFDGVVNINSSANYDHIAVNQNNFIVGGSGVPSYGLFGSIWEGTYNGTNTAPLAALIRIGSISGTGNVTNKFGIYQTSTLRNYLGGVFINGGKVAVGSSSTFVPDYTLTLDGADNTIIDYRIANTNFAYTGKSGTLFSSGGVGYGISTNTSEPIILGSGGIRAATFVNGNTLLNLSSDNGVDRLQINGSLTASTGKFANLANGIVPYHISDALGLGDSPMQTNGSVVGIGTSPNSSYSLSLSGNLKLNTQIWLTPSSGFSVIGVSGTDMQFYNGAGAETRMSITNTGKVIINDLASTNARLVSSSSTGQLTPIANGTEGQVLKIVSGVPIFADESGAETQTTTVQPLSGTTPTFNTSLGVNATLTMSGNTTITFSNLTTGTSGWINITNAATLYTLDLTGYNFRFTQNIYGNTGYRFGLSGGSKFDRLGWSYDGSVVVISGSLDLKPQP